MKTISARIAELNPTQLIRMKTKSSSLTVNLFRAVAAGLLLAVSGVAHAQNANPPERMTYQGYLTDANGVALATNATKNFDVIFRIYDAESGGTVLWGEQQTVTVDKGYFSVLLGEGSAVGARPELSTVFSNSTASVRWMGLTVKGIGAGNTDVDIAPRLRFLSSPYAYLAMNARNVTGTGVIASTNLDPAIGLWTVNGTNVFRTGGNVGIGTNNPSAQLHVFSPSFFAATIEGSHNGGTWFGLQNDSTGGRRWNLITTSTGNGEGPGKLLVHDGSPGGAVRMTYDTNGNVGIGTVNPSSTLQVNGVINARSSTATDGYLKISPGDSGSMGFINWYKPGPVSVGYMGWLAGGVNNLGMLLENGANFVINGGNVGIGTASPTALLDVRGTVAINGARTGSGVLEVYGVPGGQYCRGATMSQFTPTGVNTGIGGCGTCCPVSDISIYAQNGMWASIYYAVSDERTKIIKGQSDSKADLALLNQIKITDFTYIDTLAKGEAQHKKVIAQQVEKVLPQAIRKSTEAVPDIYKLASHKDGWVQLKTSLKVGERVRLIGEKEEGVHEVLEVKEDAFRTEFKPTTEKVFVYGREVNDFRTVDYEAISMLNVSATQELARKVEAQETELTELRAELAKLRTEKKTLASTVSELKERDDAREARLARLEASLETKHASVPAKKAVGDLSFRSNH